VVGSQLFATGVLRGPIATESTQKRLKNTIHYVRVTKKPKCRKIQIFGNFRAFSGIFGLEPIWSDRARYARSNKPSFVNLAPKLTELEKKIDFRPHLGVPTFDKHRSRYRSRFFSKNLSYLFFFDALQGSYNKIFLSIYFCIRPSPLNPSNAPQSGASVLVTS